MDISKERRSVIDPGKDVLLSYSSSGSCQNANACTYGRFKSARQSAFRRSDTRHSFKTVSYSTGRDPQLTAFLYERQLQKIRYQHHPELLERRPALAPKLQPPVVRHLVRWIATAVHEAPLPR